MSRTGVLIEATFREMLPQSLVSVNDNVVHVYVNILSVTLLEDLWKYS